MKVHISLGGNTFAVDAEATFAEIKPLLETWLLISMASHHATQEELDALAAQLKGDNDSLASVVQTHQPAP